MRLKTLWSTFLGICLSSLSIHALSASMYNSYAPVVSPYTWVKSSCNRTFSKTPSTLIIGDSISDGWSGLILDTIPNSWVIAKVGMQFYPAISILSYVKHYPQWNSVQNIVIELGTNGYVTPQQIQQFMAETDGRRVFFVIPQVPRVWGPEVVNLYESLPRIYPNVKLVYWNLISTIDGRENPALFWQDGVHPNATGARLLVDSMYKAVMEDSNVE